MNKKIITLTIVLTVFITVFSGCTSTDNSTKQPVQPQTYQKHTLICPNPNCPLHDPNYQISYGGVGTGSGKVRPIDCEVTGTYTGKKIKYHYLCQVCGEEWDNVEQTN